MAGEDYGDSGENVTTWFARSTTAATTSSSSLIVNTTAAAADSTVDIDAMASSQNIDIRMAYHAVLWTLYKAYYDNQNHSDNVNMPDDMVMTKATIKDVNGSQAKQTHVYTFRITENIASHATGAELSPQLPTETNT